MPLEELSAAQNGALLRKPGANTKIVATISATGLPAMLFGYARVSSDGQDLSVQRAALRGAGCKRLYEETASGARRDSPELARLLEQLRAGDVVVITRLDRLARSTRDLFVVATQIKQAKAGLRSLAEPWADTTSPAGRTLLTVFAGMAEFEGALLHQRTSAGRAAAKQRGVRFGRLPKLGPEQLALARRLVAEGRPVREVAGVLNCHRATLYRALDASNASDWTGSPTASDGLDMGL